MILRKMNIDRQFILSQGLKVSKEKRFGFYRWIIKVCKAR